VDCPIEKVAIGMAVEVLFEDSGREFFSPSSNPAEAPLLSLT